MSTFRVGLIGLPRIRDGLQQLGVEVVSGETFAETSRNLRAAAGPDGLPVLVEDQRQVGLVQLLARLPESSTVTVVRGDEPVLEDSWASIPITSSLGEYLRAAGAGDVDPAADEVMVDQDGQIADPIPATAPAAAAAAGPGPDLEAETAEPGGQAPGEIADWLSDDEEPADARADQDAAETAGPPTEPSPPGHPVEASALTDWLSDGDDDPGATSAPGQPPANEPDDADEDFDGLFASAAAEPATGSPAEAGATEPPDAPQDPQPRKARRKITLPSFAQRTEPEPERGLEQPRPSADESVDQDLLDELPAPEADDEPDEEAELDVDDALDALSGSSRTTTARLNTALGLVLVVYGGKGGVGKSTLALCLAQAAAETGGLSVCLIDANRGQGDLGLYLRVRKSDLPSIYDAATIGDLPSAIISPEQINTTRGGAGDQIAFWFVQAPRPQRDGDISVEAAAVDPEHYAETIALTRKRFDLVVVDTQITESLDTSGLIDRAVGPALSRGGYALGVVEFSTPGVENLLTSIAYLRRLGTDPARMMTIANNIAPDLRDYGRIPQLLGQQSRWKGVIHHDQRIYEDMVARRIPYAIPPMRAVAMDVLETITGIAEFTDPEPVADRSRQPWWKRWLAR